MRWEFIMQVAVQGEQDVTSQHAGKNNICIPNEKRNWAGKYWTVEDYGFHLTEQFFQFPLWHFLAHREEVFWYRDKTTQDIPYVLRFLD